ncbi:hypothetical protein SHIRM173S_13274 [Streptomyces hirsutus]
MSTAADVRTMSTARVEITFSRAEDSLIGFRISSCTSVPRTAPTATAKTRPSQRGSEKPTTAW